MQDLENPARKHNMQDLITPSYKQFTDTIFGLERKAIITQEESLNEDLDNMDLSDKVFKKDPKKFKRRDYDSLPDVKRCTFIRKHKNKYIRCAMSITDDGNDDNSDVCYKHESSVNMYWDNYCSLINAKEKEKKNKYKKKRQILIIK